MSLDLPLIWALLIAFAVFAYVVLDGFDLGIGILFPLFEPEEERGLMMNTIAPVWDGNETWLVLGGGGLFAAFPLAYAVLMPALYAPITIMLLGLIFRGVAFEYRFRTVRWRHAWDLGFFAGSLIAAFCQGLALGTFIQGVDVEGRAYAGGWFDWLTPFTVLTGAALVSGYALLGATWLIMKTEGRIRERCYGYAYRAGTGVIAGILLVSLATPIMDATIAGRWFGWPNIALVSPVPILVALLALGLWRALRDRRDHPPFPLALGLFALSYLGLGISFFPYVVPRSITIWQAAAPDSSLAFMLVGAAILLPIILAYTAYAYWVFRGKVDPSEGYH